MRTATLARPDLLTHHDRDPFGLPLNPADLEPWIDLDPADLGVLDGDLELFEPDPTGDDGPVVRR